MDVTHLFAGIAVSDFAAACDWYERAFDSRADAFPTEGEALWHLAATATIYITVDRARAGHGLVALAVTDLDDRRADLARCGVRAAEGAESNGMRTLTVADPDGNTIKFFQDPVGRRGRTVGS